MIQSSELIINPDGSIYHLGIKPGELHPLIITVGDPHRINMITKYFDEVDLRIERREFVTVSGKYKGLNLSLISTGIGTDNIDIVLNEVDALFNIDFNSRRIKDELQKIYFIRIGTSGSIQESIAVDSFLYSKYAMGMDGLMHNYDYQNTNAERDLLSSILDSNTENKFSLQPYLFSNGEKLDEIFKNEMNSGITITAAGFYGPQSRSIRLPLKNESFIESLVSKEYLGERFTNLEMETAGIYGLSRLLGHEAISLNAILANRPLGQFSKTPESTVDGLIRKCLDVLERNF